MLSKRKKYQARFSRLYYTSRVSGELTEENQYPTRITAFRVNFNGLYGQSTSKLYFLLPLDRILSRHSIVGLADVPTRICTLLAVIPSPSTASSLCLFLFVFLSIYLPPHSLPSPSASFTLTLEYISNILFSPRPNNPNPV